MSTVEQAVDDFLSVRRIAVAGVSREKGGKHGGNVVYQRLKERGYDVFPVNPNADTVEGDPCYKSIASIPDGVEGVVIATNPSDALSVAEECKSLGIDKVWMHKNFGQGSYSKDAHDYCRQNGIAAIAGGCPLMYEPTADGMHKVMRTFCGWFGQLPREV